MTGQMTRQFPVHQQIVLVGVESEVRRAADWLGSNYPLLATRREEDLPYLRDVGLARSFLERAQRRIEKADPHGQDPFWMRYKEMTLAMCQAARTEYESYFAGCVIPAGPIIRCVYGVPDGTPVTDTVGKVR